MGAAISARGLVKTFGPTRALDGLDLEVATGEVHGFLGPNGSGKSTTIRVLLGLLRADAGEVEVLGSDPWRDAADLHRRLAYVAGDVELWPTLSGGEIIDLLGRLRGGLDERRRAELLERFQLDPTKKARTYSKGNRQKVALVAALASDVELYLLDEPTSGLDPLMEIEFQRAIREVTGNGSTVLLSSHILGEVEELCDRVSIIRQGRTVERGTLQELRHLTRTAVVAELSAQPAGFAELAGVHDLQIDGSTVRFSVDSVDLAPVLEHLARSGVRSLTSSPPTLEELFLRHYDELIGRIVLIHLTGTGPLARLVLRRDRVRLAVWVGAIALLTYTQVAGLKGLYPDRQSLAEAGQLVQDNAAFIAMAGPPVALDTLGGRTAFEISAFGMVLAALMNLFLVTRHLRGDEEAGRAELLRSTVVGRHASITAVLATALLADAVLGGLLFAVLIGTGLPAGGSAALAAGIAGVGLLFAGMAAVSSQVTEGTRAASGIAGVALAVSFVLRAIGDVGDGRLSWLSPLGWGQALRPYGGERWWVLALMAAALVALIWSAYRINSHRDLGAGIVPPRAGPARAEPGLLSPTGLAVRLHRGALAGWTLALLLAGVAYGSISGDVEDFVGDNETIADIMAQAGGDLVESFLSTTALVLAMIATAYSVQATLRMRSEEQAGRAEPVLAGALSRWRWAGSHLQVVVAGTLVVLAAAGLGTGVTYGLIDGDAGHVPRLLAASLVHAPAALVVVGVTVALYGFVPRFAVAGWALVAALFVMGFFGDILSLPEWFLELSPFHHVPSLPAEDVAVLPLVLLSVLAAALIGLGLAGLRRRDLQT